MTVRFDSRQGKEEVLFSLLRKGQLAEDDPDAGALATSSGKDSILTAANTHRESNRDRMGHKNPVPLISETVEVSEEASK